MPQAIAPIGDHAMLSDCRSAALVTCDGVIDWWPSPRFDSASAFSALLDEDAGHWSVQPAGRFERGEWRYEPGTLVAQTTLIAERGTLRLTDALALQPGARGHAIGRESLHRVLGTFGELPIPLDAHAALEDTARAWRSWSDEHQGYDGLHADAVGLAGRVLQGLTYQPTGGVVAAATTSLPEVPGGEDNFDYRFVWLRDAAMIAQALSSSACSDEALRYFTWMTRAGVTCRQEEQIQIVFGVEAERDLSEHRLEHLAGHRGARPVRIGNAAWRQKQLDVLGHVLDCAWILREELDTPDAFTAGFLWQLADRAARQWREPDSSIWEGREGERHYVVSKLYCWVALDRAVRLAERWGADAKRWAATRDEIRAAILHEAWHPARQAFMGAFGSDHLDVSVLLMPLVGFLDAGDRRMDKTVRLLEDELGDDGLLRRWSGAEDGAFLLASFWLAECHARAGRIERAHHGFERAAGAANHLGLLAEEVDAATGAPLGNVPQAISHVGLINAASALSVSR